ncbi:MAG: peptidylprolyl isomerase [Gammaproteobacteria bacterium]|mgnify:FL=1|jgi:FKBP-type peptidyl-prolyl cis-trans isomerase SlpA|nr:peptidylprolyl isomerase [Gammaproteobacteria bacterium]NCW08539.1 peptidylprolyl isomerase [Gammaproteobacteria bacterium]NCW73571.1 peptidylprolyl isomerase [Gammaproteobacteria bacterium]NCX48066.1 peptidylprolyl isomerase [Gammaproteobacteria bacterium]
MLDIGPNCKVELHFSLKLADTGELVDSTFEKKPAELVIGDGNLPAAFEAVIHGMKAGERKIERIEPKDGFGQHNPSNVQKISKDQFDPSVELSEGLVVSFQDKAKSELPGVVAAIDDKMVTVDFNHPLAGRELEFEVEILSVAPAETH